jgi:membrane associated rhomboid family serine protease
MAQDRPAESQPFLRVPAATLGLVAALAVVHVARVMLPPERSEGIIDDYAFFPARYSEKFLAAHNVNPGTLLDQAIPFVSYMFLHANFMHLLMNCAWLLPFGAITARRYGPIGFCVLFVVCGIAGAVAHLISHWGTPDYALGASAAVAGLMAAGLRVVAEADRPIWMELSRNPERIVELPLAPILSQRMLVWSGLVLVIFVIGGRWGIGAGPVSGPVAWQAHIGGFLAGLLLAGPFDRVFRAGRARSPVGRSTAA